MKKFTLTTEDGFFVSDPCYALPEEAFNLICGKEEGIYKDPVSGKEFVMFYTVNGDGYIQNDTEDEYPIESGMVTICPTEVIDENKFDPDMGDIIIRNEITIRKEDDGFSVGGWFPIHYSLTAI